KNPEWIAKGPNLGDTKSSPRSYGSILGALWRDQFLSLSEKLSFSAACKAQPIFSSLRHG
ncbi:MAG TPA: hypothetical protein VHX20_07105, partial [Terracidiphilus sp.]|nr:hypothetical protein [Terracidiphilus sp.]